MDVILKLTRLVPLIAGALIAATSLAAAQADPERPVTPPDSYRVVMENDRVRMIEIHVKPRSKVNVDLPAERERFLYMLSDGALILAPPGKTPYEFALHAGETAVFPGGVADGGERHQLGGARADGRGEAADAQRRRRARARASADTWAKASRASKSWSRVEGQDQAGRQADRKPQASTRRASRSHPPRPLNLARPTPSRRRKSPARAGAAAARLQLAACTGTAP